MSSGYELISSRAVLGMFGDVIETFEGTSWIPEISMGPVTSDQEVEDYPFLGHVPTLSPKNGPPKPSQLRVKNITIRNDEFDSAIGIPDKWRRRDKTGQLDQRTAEFGDAQSVHWVELTSPLLADGETGVSFTGSPFYSATHQWGESPIQSNIVSLSFATDIPVSTPGTFLRPNPQAIAYAGLQTMKRIMKFRSDRNKLMHMNRRSWLWLFSSRLWDAGVAALANMVLNVGEENLLKGFLATGHTIRAEINPELDDAFDLPAESSFLVFAIDAPRKALIRQEEDLAGSVAGIDLQMLDEKSDHYKLNREIVLIAYASRGIGYGDPLVTAKCKLAA